MHFAGAQAFVARSGNFDLDSDMTFHIVLCKDQCHELNYVNVSKICFCI